MSMHLKRTATILKPDQSRVLLRPFSPGGPERVARIIGRIMALPEDRVNRLLDEVSAEFSQRHQPIRNLFLQRFEQVRESLATVEGISGSCATITAFRIALLSINARSFCLIAITVVGSK